MDKSMSISSEFLWLPSVAGEEQRLKNAAEAISSLTAAIEDKDVEVGQLEKSLKEEGYMREQASQQFTTQYANNEAAVKLLGKVWKLNWVFLTAI